LRETSPLFVFLPKTLETPEEYVIQGDVLKLFP